jgi:hypothetical protein
MLGWCTISLLSAIGFWIRCNACLVVDAIGTDARMLKSGIMGITSMLRWIDTGFVQYTRHRCASQEIRSEEIHAYKFPSRRSPMFRLLTCSNTVFLIPGANCAQKSASAADPAASPPSSASTLLKMSGAGRYLGAGDGDGGVLALEEEPGDEGGVRLGEVRDGDEGGALSKGRSKERPLRELVDPVAVDAGDARLALGVDRAEPASFSRFKTR